MIFQPQGVPYTSHKWMTTAWFSNHRGTIYLMQMDDFHAKWVGFRGTKGSKMCMKFSWRVQPFFGWISYCWRMNVIEIHTPTVQYISHKWIKWVWFSNHKGYHIPHINGWLQYDFPTTGVQYISHKMVSNHRGTKYLTYVAKPGYDFLAPWVLQWTHWLLPHS